MDLLREAGVEEVALIAEPKVQGLAPWRRPTTSTPQHHKQMEQKRRLGEADGRARRLGRDVRHQHHAAHRRDAGAADHLHGRDAARAEGPRHLAAAAASAEPAASRRRRPTRWCSALEEGGRSPSTRTRSTIEELESRLQRHLPGPLRQDDLRQGHGQGALRQGGAGDGPRQGRRRRAHRHHLREDDRRGRRRRRRPAARPPRAAHDVRGLAGALCRPCSRAAGRLRTSARCSARGAHWSARSGRTGLAEPEPIPAKAPGPAQHSHHDHVRRTPGPERPTGSTAQPGRPRPPSTSPAGQQIRSAAGAAQGIRSRHGRPPPRTYVRQARGDPSRPHARNDEGRRPSREAPLRGAAEAAGDYLGASVAAAASGGTSAPRRGRPGSPCAGPSPASAAAPPAPGTACAPPGSVATCAFTR